MLTIIMVGITTLRNLLVGNAVGDHIQTLLVVKARVISRGSVYNWPTTLGTSIGTPIFRKTEADRIIAVYNSKPWWSITWVRADGERHVGCSGGKTCKFAIVECRMGIWLHPPNGAEPMQSSPNRWWNSEFCGWKILGAVA